MTNEQVLEELKRFADAKIDGVEKRLSRSISRLERKVEKFDSNFNHLEEKVERHEANALDRFAFVQDVTGDALTIMGKDLRHRLDAVASVLADVVVAMLVEAGKHPGDKSPRKND